MNDESIAFVNSWLVMFLHRLISFNFGFWIGFPVFFSFFSWCGLNFDSPGMWCLIPSSLRKILVIEQVKFFLSKDCPSNVRLQAQDCMQAKTLASCLKNVHSVNHHSRFEGGCSTDPLPEKPSDITQIKWKCPPNVSKISNSSRLPLLEPSRHAAKDTSPCPILLVYLGFGMSLIVFSLWKYEMGLPKLSLTNS